MRKNNVPFGCVVGLPAQIPRESAFATKSNNFSLLCLTCPERKRAFPFLHACYLSQRFSRDIGLFKVNLEMGIFGFDLENEISVGFRKWKLKTQILTPRLENPRFWLLRKKKLSKNLTNIFVQNFRQKKSSKYKLKLKMKYEVNVRSDIQI